MHAAQPDLFDTPADPSPQTYSDAFATWLASREDVGTLREASSAAVYGSMWSALSAWCVGSGLPIDALTPGDLEAYLLSRRGTEELSARYAWRLLTLADAVLSRRAATRGVQRNTAAHDLLMATPDWRYANAHDKTPLPEHLHAQEARALVAWLLDPAGGNAEAGAPARSWQAVRNRTAVALQLGAGLTPGDVRAAVVDGVVTTGGKVAQLPWKIRLPAHGGIAARDAPIAPWAGRVLRHWLHTRASLQATGPALFPAARDGRPWGKVAQYTAAKAVLAAAGMLDTEGGSYKLRHTFALRQLRRGTPAEQVAQWMGLSDTAALARYRQVLLAPADVV
jgi:integrase